jgi:hypothetical protein
MDQTLRGRSHQGLVDEFCQQRLRVKYKKTSNQPIDISLK